jgi:hypothetical protein
VPLQHTIPGSFQRENWLLEPSQRWKRVGQISRDELSLLVDSPDALWVNDSSTRIGLRDRVALPDAENLQGSLYLLNLNSLMLRVMTTGADFGEPRQRVQAVFAYRGVEYRLWLTDPVAREQYLRAGNGIYTIGSSYVTVSLAKPYADGFCYKVVAGLIIASQVES